MNEENHPTPPEFPTPEASAQDPSNQSSQNREETSHSEFREAFEEFKRAARRVWDEGSGEARRATGSARSKARETVDATIQGLFHDLAWTSGFASRVMREFMSEDVQEASRQGTSEGDSAAEDFLRRRREDQPGESSQESTPDDGDVPPEQPYCV